MMGASTLYGARGGFEGPIQDSFNRVDGAMGITEIGNKAWAGSGIWKIVSNQAKTDTVFSSKPVLLVDTVDPDGGSVSAICPPGGGVMFRGNSPTNYYIARFFSAYSSSNSTDTDYKWTGTYNYHTHGTGTLASHNHVESKTYDTSAQAGSTCPFDGAISHAHSHLGYNSLGLTTYYETHTHFLSSCNKTSFTASTTSSSTINYYIQLEYVYNGGVSLISRATAPSSGKILVDFDSTSCRIMVNNSASASLNVGTLQNLNGTLVGIGAGDTYNANTANRWDDFNYSEL